LYVLDVILTESLVLLKSKRPVYPEVATLETAGKKVLGQFKSKDPYALKIQRMLHEVRCDENRFVLNRLASFRRIIPTLPHTSATLWGTDRCDWPGLCNELLAGTD
jgi:hypothetical protein